MHIEFEICDFQKPLESTHPIGYEKNTLHILYLSSKHRTDISEISHYNFLELMTTKGCKQLIRKGS